MARRKCARSVCRRMIVELVNGLATSRDAGRSDDAIPSASLGTELSTMLVAGVARRKKRSDDAWFLGEVMRLNSAIIGLWEALVTWESKLGLITTIDDPKAACVSRCALCPKSLNPKFNHISHPSIPSSSSVAYSAPGIQVTAFVKMLRTGVTRALYAVTRTQLPRQLPAFRTRISSSLLQSGRVGPSLAVSSIRCYSAPAGLSKDEVQGRIMDLLKNFDKVCSQNSSSALTLGSLAKLETGHRRIKGIDKPEPSGEVLF